MNFLLTPCRKRCRATDRPEQTHAGASVDASLQLPQLTHNKTHTNDELDATVPASPPSPFITDPVSQRTLQEREASPPIAPVPQSERTQLGERAHHLGDANERTHLEITSSNIHLFDEAIRRLSATIDREWRAFTLEILGETEPLSQQVASNTLQEAGESSRVSGGSTTTEGISTDAPAYNSTLHPRSNDEPLAAKANASDTSIMGKPNQVEEVQIRVRTILPSLPSRH